MPCSSVSPLSPFSPWGPSVPGIAFRPLDALLSNVALIAFLTLRSSVTSIAFRSLDTLFARVSLFPLKSGIALIAFRSLNALLSSITLVTFFSSGASISFISFWTLRSSVTFCSCGSFRAGDALFTLRTWAAFIALDSLWAKFTLWTLQSGGALFTGGTTVSFFSPVAFRSRRSHGARIALWTDRTAVLMTAFVFAVCHGNLTWMCYAFAMGWLLAFVSVKEDNIFYSIIMHMAFNLWTVIQLIIRRIDNLQEFLFGSRILIFGYGLLAFLVLTAWFRMNPEFTEAAEKWIRGKERI